MPLGDADRRLLSAVHDPIVAIDAHGVVLSASDSVERVFGWTPRELIGRKINMLMPEPNRSLHDGYLERHAGSGASAILNRVCRLVGAHRSGMEIPLDIAVTRIAMDDDGGPIFVGVLRDVSERAAEELELRLGRDLAITACAAETADVAFARIVRTLGVALEADVVEGWMIAADGRSIRCRARWTAAAALPGAPERNDLATRPLPANGTRGWSLAEAAWERGEPVIVECGPRTETDARPDEGVAPAAAVEDHRLAIAVPLRSEARPVGAVAIGWNGDGRHGADLATLLDRAVAPIGVVVERKAARDRLVAHERELVELIAERQREVTELAERLHAIERTAFLGTLAAGVVHDLHGILLPVRAHLEALSTGDATPSADSAGQRERHLDALRRCADHIERVADGFRILLGGETEGRGDVDVGQWWRDIGPIVRDLVPKSIRLDLSIEDGLPPVPISEGAFGQIVVNLVGNAVEAIQARRDGAPARIRVRCDADGAGRSVRLSVTDDGVGMDEQVRRAATDLFFTTKRHSLGTGIGLAVVRTVVERAGGSIEIESRPGYGTTVSILLPTFGRADRRSQSRRAEPNGSTAGNRTVAIAMADRRGAALVRQLVEGLGGAVLGAADSEGVGVFVADLSEDALDRVIQWRKVRPTGTLILIGAVDGAAADAWRDLDVGVVESGSDVGSLRQTLRRALDGPDAPPHGERDST